LIGGVELSSRAIRIIHCGVTLPCRSSRSRLEHAARAIDRARRAWPTGPSSPYARVKSRASVRSDGHHPSFTASCTRLDDARSHCASMLGVFEIDVDPLSRRRATQCRPAVSSTHASRGSAMMYELW
jgi:hypothetical protein